MGRASSDKRTPQQLRAENDVVGARLREAEGTLAAIGEPESPYPSSSVLQSLGELPPLRVLLAEDNRENRAFLQSAFQDGGEPFDLVLMDIQMPVLDGLAAIRATRRLAGGEAIVPIIAPTAFAVKGVEQDLLAMGADGYGCKPVDFGPLAAEIRRVLSLPNPDSR